jgi:hypothetical protein
MDKRGECWTSLTDEQENTLVDLAVDQLGHEFSKSKFVDCVHSLLDSNTWTYDNKVVPMSYVEDGVKVKGTEMVLGWLPIPVKRPRGSK